MVVAFRWSKLIVTLLILTGVFNKVNAQISASVTSGCSPLTGVVFNHNYTGATGVVWNFGDGASSNLNNPSHTFANAGTFNVTFNATLNGNPISEQIVINVYPNPVASFHVNEPHGGCVGMQVSFQDQSTGGGGVAITQWNWAYGDGGVNTINTPNPVYTYNLPGVYDVSLIVTDANGCVSSSSQEDAVAISTPPTVTITPPTVTITTTPSPPSACLPPLAVTFGATVASNSPLGNAVTYNWNFGNGQTSTSANPPVQNYTTQGTFVATLTVTDANGCSSNATRNVSVSQPIASLVAIGAFNDTICANALFDPSASLGFPTNYNYGDGTSGTSTSHTYTTEGWFDVTLTVQSGPCQDDTTISVYVQIPTVSISFPHDTICEFPFPYQLTANSNSSIASYTWNLPSGNTATEPMVNDTIQMVNDTIQYEELEYSINKAVNGIISVEVITAAGCTASDSHSFVAVKPNALFFPDKDEGCAPLSITFTDYSTSDIPEISQWIWHFGDSSPNLTTTEPDDVTHVYTNPGIYHPYLVVVTTGGCVVTTGGCRDTSWIHTISAGVAPNASFSLNPAVVCPGDLIQLIDNTPLADSVDTWNYNGDSNLLFSCQNEPNPEVTFGMQTGISEITMTVGNRGCYATSTQQITVNGPTGHMEYTCNCETPMTYPFEAIVSDADSWTWDFGDGTTLNNSVATNLSHTYTQTGDYMARITIHNSTSGCPSVEDSLLIRVRNLIAMFTAPDSLCADESFTFSSAGSIDVSSMEGSCYNGFIWNFGDQTQPKMTDSIYDHAFVNAGEYIVELWVRDVNGCMDSTSHAVKVFDVESNFSFLADGVCLPLSAQFTNQSTSDLPITNYAWTFGDGGNSSVENPAHIYSANNIPAGGNIAPFNVTLNVQNALGCTSSSTQQIATNIPSAIFQNLSPTTICEGGSVTFKPAIAQPGNQFAWNFGDSQTSAQYQPTHTFADAGSYAISLTVTNANGCNNSNTINNYVTAQAYPIAGFNSSIVSGEAICYPAQITFTDTSIVNPFGSRTWNLGNGVPAIGSVTIGANYNTPGIYTISLIERTTAGCADTAYLSINVEGPLGTFNLSPATICRGESATICRGESIQITMADTADVATWHWDFGDGTDASEMFSFEHEYDFDFNPESGQTIVSLVLWNADSICNTVVTRDVNFIFAEADFRRNNETAVADTAHCVGIADNFFNLSSISLTSVQTTSTSGIGTLETGKPLADRTRLPSIMHPEFMM